MTAVSTTGFAEGAVEFAKNSGIEIREVNEVAPEHFADWLAIRSMHTFERRLHLNQGRLCVAETEPAEHQNAILEAIEKKPLDSPLLRSTETGETISVLKAFEALISANLELFDDVVPNGPRKSVELRARYDNDASHFVVETKLRPIRITEILFGGEIAVEHAEAPLMHTSEYCPIGSGESISRSAAFMVPINDKRFALELHRITSSGETHLVLLIWGSWRTRTLQCE